MYHLRSYSCFQSSVPATFDSLVQNLITKCLNISFASTALEQAALPVRWGGLGIRSASSLAPSAFLASISASSVLIASLLPEKYRLTLDPLVDAAISCWLALGGVIIPSPDIAHIQRKWDEQICSSKAKALLQTTDSREKARLFGVQATGSGSWLHALPSAALGLRLSDD